MTHISIADLIEGKEKVNIKGARFRVQTCVAFKVLYFEMFFIQIKTKINFAVCARIYYSDICWPVRLPCDILHFWSYLSNRSSFSDII